MNKELLPRMSVMRKYQPIDLSMGGGSKCLHCKKHIKDTDLFHDCMEGYVDYYQDEAIKEFAKELLRVEEIDFKDKTTQRIINFLSIKDIDYKFLLNQNE